MSAPRLLLVVLISLLATAALGWLARAPHAPPGTDHGVLRLSWRLRGERIETCRARTPEELAALPVHMRTPEVCVGRLVAYRVTAQVDEAVPDTATVLPGGARGDRPVFVLRELPLPPGARRVRVTLERADGEHREAAHTLDTTLVAEPGAVELVTLDAETGRLVHRRSAER
jgi:hypothetical protein